MRYLLVLLLIAGCDAGEHYQIATANTNSVWRVNTKTGELAYCYIENTRPTCIPRDAPWLKDKVQR